MELDHSTLGHHHVVMCDDTDISIDHHNSNHTLTSCQQQFNNNHHHQQQQQSGNGIVFDEDLLSSITTNTSIINNPSSSSSSGSYPSSPSIVPNSSPFDNCIGSPETTYDHIPNIIQYTDFINPFDQSIPNLSTTSSPISTIDDKLIIQTTTVTSTTSNNPNNYNDISAEIISADSTPTSSNPLSTSSDSSVKSPLINSTNSTPTKDENKKPSKKRTTESRIQNIVHPLSREELLKLTGKEPVKIVESPTNTPDDEKTVKKQRRLIKNRESAQLSRMRKKIYIEDLEKKIGDLTEDNNSLREEVLYLQGIIKQLAGPNSNSILQNSPVNNQQQQSSSTSMSLDIGNSNNNNNNNVNSNINNRSKNVKAASVCLLIIFFSFGVFFNQPTNPTFSNSLSSSNGRALAPFESERTTTHSLLTLNEDPSTEPSIPPQSPLQSTISVPSSPVISPVPSSPSLSLSSDLVLNVATTTTTNKQNNNINTKKRSIKEESGDHHKKRMKIIPEGGHNDHYEDPPNDGGHHQQHLLGSSVTSPDLRIIESPSHSSYIICSDQPRLISNNITQTTESILNSNSSSPLTIGLLLPADSLGNSIVTNQLLNGSPLDRSILEISCQVQNIRVWNPVSVESSQQHRVSSENSVVISL
eukprot:gene10895-13350_t